MHTQTLATIEKIERVQNRKLWRVFNTEVEDVTNKLKNLDIQLKVLMLYHGTSGTPPETIFKSEEGFDMTFAKEGMWGIANYFAKNSSYSNKYAYKLKNGSQ